MAVPPNCLEAFHTTQRHVYVCVLVDTLHVKCQHSQKRQGARVIRVQTSYLSIARCAEVEEDVASCSS